MECMLEYSTVLSIVPEPENSLQNDDQDRCVPVETSLEEPSTIEEQFLDATLPSGNTYLSETEGSPQNEELDYLDPTIKDFCTTEVEEFKRLGKDFWVCQYEEDPVDVTPINGNPLHEPIRILVTSGGFLQLNYLRCLVWFGLGAEKTRNILSQSFGDFLII